MEPDLQLVDGRLVDFRRSALQQLHNQLLGFFEVTAQKLALRAFEPQAERQLVLAAPGPFRRAGPCRPQKTRTPTHRPPTPWPFARHAGRSLPPALSRPGRPA